MDEVADQSPAGDVLLVLALPRGPCTLKEPRGYMPRIIDAGFNRKLHGAPRPPIDLHQIRSVGVRVMLELHHPDPLKPGSDHQIAAELEDVRGEGDRLAGAARAAARVLFANSLPLKGQVRLTVDYPT
jgi:hypothetical protein